MKKFLDSFLVRRALVVNLLALFVLAASWGWLYSLMHIRDVPLGMPFETAVWGEGVTPQQYRVLLPLIARLIEPLIPYIPFIQNLQGILLLFEFTSSVLLVIIFFWSTDTILSFHFPELPFTTRAPISFVCLACLLLALPYMTLIGSSSHFYYVYDIPSVAFIALGVGLLVKGKWGWYYLVFVIAILNRETACFLTIIYCLMYLTVHSRKLLIIHFLAQGALWIIIKFALYVAFLENIDTNYADGLGLFKNSIAYNLEILMRPGFYQVFPSVYGYLWIPLIVVCRKTPAHLKRALYTIPIFHVSMFIPGEILELRIYLEMLPLVVWGVVIGAFGHLVDSSDYKNVLTK